ncbi:MAG: hypothetical protein HC862_07215 [Scytonema sp. RU_4_4]|nr:hypothetical protein [Scytonema sp. RU_4_4]NJR72845.1 hypothetical protein [Scytonema sp. CRU_2_7]
MRITKKSISFFLAFLGTLSFSTSASAIFQQERATTNFIPEAKVRELSKRDLIAVKTCQGDKGRPNQPYIKTQILFHTDAQKSVRVYSPTQNANILLMNIYDSRNKVELLPPTEPRLEKPYNSNQIIYSVRGKNATYYTVVFKQSGNAILIITPQSKGNNQVPVLPIIEEAQCLINNNRA